MDNNQTKDTEKSVLIDATNNVVDICIEAVDQYYYKGKDALIEFLKSLKHPVQ